MDTFDHKSEKIHHFITKARGKINLHEIKAETGAGNGLKHNIPHPNYRVILPNISEEAILHKSERITHFIEHTIGKVNLHHVKSQTGAGSGFKHHDDDTSSYSTNSNSNPSDFNHKSERIHHAVSNTEGKVNLHHIKAQTGAGSGFKHH